MELMTVVEQMTFFILLSERVEPRWTPLLFVVIYIYMDVYTQYVGVGKLAISVGDNSDLEYIFRCFFLLVFVDAVGSLAFGVVVSFAFAPYKSEKSLCCTLSSLDHQPQA